MIIARQSLSCLTRSGRFEGCKRNTQFHLRHRAPFRPFPDFSLWRVMYQRFVSIQSILTGAEVREVRGMGGKHRAHHGDASRSLCFKSLSPMVLLISTRMTFDGS